MMPASKRHRLIDGGLPVETCASRNVPSDRQEQACSGAPFAGNA